ncbi:CHAT domain-containing protein, partial [Leptolyngbya sp. FACHB-711]|nr:CHAT domain-containing protein [Leptolyngbya sp. FACHB-711]
AVETSNSPLTQIQARLNQLNLLIAQAEWETAEEQLPQIQQQINQLPLTQAGIYAQINFAQSLLKGRGYWSTGSDDALISEIEKILLSARVRAEILSDPRAMSYAIGRLGSLYEVTQQWTEAENLTRRALLQAQSLVNAPEITYLWQWQLGRILKAQMSEKSGAEQIKYRTEAIAAYDEAIKTLQLIKADLSTIDRGEQFSFRERVEPAYRELIELRLQAMPQISLEQQLSRNNDQDNQNLDRARKTLEALQIAELQNFFREGCIDAPVIALDEVIEKTSNQQMDADGYAAKAAFIYPIILPDQIAVVLKLPRKEQPLPLLYYSTKVKQEFVEETLLNLRRQITDPENSTEPFKEPAQQVYCWLIQPAVALLRSQDIKTLVFVLDGFLKNIPMAVLYDGQQYLIEQYGIALTPGLSLPDPKPLDRDRLSVLFAGLSKAEGFSDLPFVQEEEEQIREILQNGQQHSFASLENFKREDLQERIAEDSFQIIHLATHGKFSSNQDETFIMAADGEVSVTDLEQILRRNQSGSNSIELLVLSACQTADGDN